MAAGADSAMQSYVGGARGGTAATGSLLPSKNVNGTMPNNGTTMPSLVSQKEEIEELNMNPQELG